MYIITNLITDGTVRDKKKIPAEYIPDKDLSFSWRIKCKGSQGSILNDEMPNCKPELGFVFELDNFPWLYALTYMLTCIKSRALDSFRRKSLHNRFLKIQQVNFVSAVQSSL